MKATRFLMALVTHLRTPRPCHRGAAHNPNNRSAVGASIQVKICRSLIPATANACVPICTPTGGGVIACAYCCRTIVCTPMYAAIDASDAHRCQWTANSGVRRIN